MFSNFADKTAATDKLMDLQGASAVWALLSLFNDPFPYAIFTT
jgi:hypothetical protein